MSVNGGVWSFWEIEMTPCCVFFCDELESLFWSSRQSRCHLPERNGYEKKKIHTVGVRTHEGSVNYFLTLAH